MESSKKDMVIFLIKLLVLQTVVYALLYLSFYLNDLITNDAKVLWKPMVLIFYCVSVLITFIIPLYRTLKR